MMEQYGLWLLLAAGELVFILALLLLATWLRQREVVRRDRKAIRALVERVRKGKIQRRDQIRSFLSGRFGLSGDELTELGCAIHRAEMSLIQSFASAYLNRNAAKAANFAVEVEAGVEPYWRLSAEVTSAASATEDAAAESEAAQQATAEAATADEVAQDDGEVERLRGENNRLSEELRVTMDTMSRMLNEYSTIFSKDTDLSDITVVDTEAETASDESDAEPGDAEAARPVDTEEQTIAAAAEQGEAASPETADEPAVDASDADTAAVAAAQDDQQVGETDAQAVADRAPPLDPAMRDLSGDDEQAAHGADADSPAAQAQQRQRMIDADS